MPLWRIYSHPSTFNEAQKEALASEITAIYTGFGLPAFYVNVLFIPLEEGNLYVGGRRTRTFVRFAIEHIARNFPELKDDVTKVRARTCARIDAVSTCLHVMPAAPCEANT
jgi:phenylpyruvate tautomerase PptA (4-oxalocrotonate tautomerase family)